jgi:peptidyl-arginine deiminase
VTGINCIELIWGLGALHCMTMQQPADARKLPDSASPPAQSTSS